MPHVVQRKDKYVEGIIEHFDEKLKGFDGDTRSCWQNLLPDESRTLNSSRSIIMIDPPVR